MAARYLIRFDDVCPTMNWRVWDCVDALLEEYKIRPIVAIVPDNLDEKLVCHEAREDFWSRAREWQRRGWAIGLHGYQHLYSSPSRGILGIHAGSEFAGHQGSVQRAKLAAGVEILRAHGLVPKIWVAPGHAFDETTVRLLPEFGIRVISDGFYLRSVLREGCVWIPQQLWRFRSLPFGLWTVCLHINSWKEDAVERFSRDLEKFRQRIVDVEYATSGRRPTVSVSDRAFELIYGSTLRMKARWASTLTV
jgi:predicted deacetylase